jgi:hypothetical protein
MTLKESTISWRREKSVVATLPLHWLTAITLSMYSLFYHPRLFPDVVHPSGTTVPNQPAGVFWAVLNRLLIIGQVFILFLSEVGWPATFFDRFFPVLGRDFGLGALGTIQCL